MKSHTQSFIESHGINKPTKVCRKCRTEKKKSDFPRDNRPDGRHPYCNDCKREYAKEYYLAHTDLIRDKRRKWVEENPDKAKAHNAINSNVRTGTIKKPTKCSICGKGGRIEAHHWRGYGEKHRLDVQWLCRLCHEEQERLLL